MRVSRTTPVLRDIEKVVQQEKLTGKGINNRSSHSGLVLFRRMNMAEILQVPTLRGSGFGSELTIR